MKEKSGKGKARPTLGDATNLLDQWRAAKAVNGTSAELQKAEPVAAKSEQQIEQTLRSWKRGGAEVKVTHGKTNGFELRQQLAAQRSAHRALAESSKVETHVAQRLAPPMPARAPQSVPVQSEKSLQQRLQEASADMRQLKIAAAMSRSREYLRSDPVTDESGGRLAILGLDFGTAFTKAVVRWNGHHYAVDWTDAVEGEDPHLLASVFSERDDGTCVLGACNEACWSIREGIKLRLLIDDDAATNEGLVDAVIFIALAFRYVDAWLRKTNPDATLRWRLHVGLPTRSWDDDATTATFKKVAQAGRVLACSAIPVSRAGALKALSMTDQVDRPAVDVFPEFACQLFSYLQSAERRDDLHALVDIGAGTVDAAFFNVFEKDGEMLLPIFASEVEKLGAHYLIAALAGAENREEWRDSESSLTDEEAARKVGCSASDVCGRRSLYLSSVAGLFNSATCTAREMYSTSPAFRRGESVRLFLCGGGSRIPALKQRFDRIALEAERVMRIRFHVSELVSPRDIVGKFRSAFDRMSVAYGLSHNAANIGAVMRSATLEPLEPRERLTTMDRDDDR